MEAFMPGKATGIFFEARPPTGQGFGDELRRSVMTASPTTGEQYLQEWQEEGELFGPRIVSMKPPETNQVR